MSLLDRFGRAYQALRGPDPTTPLVRPSVQLGELAFADPRRLLFGGKWFTPYNPSQLVTKKGMKIFDLMRRDDQIKAALAFKKRAVLSTKWEVVSPDGESEDWEVTNFVRDVLTHLDDSLQNTLLRVLTALDYGFSVSEKVYQLADEGDWVGKVTLKAIKTRRPHEFDFQTDEYGNLLPNGLMQWQGGGQKHLPIDKFILYAHDFEFSNWYGTSDLEAAYRPWWTKDNAYKWLAILLERCGVPPMFFLYEPNSYGNPATLDQLKLIAQNMQAATSGVIPRPGGKDALEPWTPELAGQATDVFLPAVDMFNRDISRAILMPGLLGMSPEKSGGSLARAQVNFDVFMLVVEHLRVDQETRVMMEQVIKPLVDLNYAVTSYPIWRLLPITDDKRVQLLQEWTAAVQAKAVRPQLQDENHIRAVLGFENYDENADDLNPTTEVPPNGQNPLQDTATGDHQPLPGTKTPPQGQVGDPTRTKKESTRIIRHRQRAPNRFEQVCNFARIDKTLNRAEAMIRESLTDSYLVVRDAMTRQLQQQVSQMTPSWVGRMSLPGGDDRLAQISRFSLDTFERGRAELRREVPKAFAAPNYSPAEAMAWLAAQDMQMAQVLDQRLLAKVKQLLLNALKNGQPMGDTVMALEALFEPYIGNASVLQDGDPIQPYQLETVIRTNATAAFNHGRLVAANEVASLLHGMEYSAVLDSRTTDVCRLLDGKILPMGSAEIERLSPPRHFNCRSLLVPITESVTVEASQFITPAEVGRAIQLSGEGF